MFWLVIFLGALLVVVIGVVAVGAVTSRLAEQAPVSVFDQDEAVDWIADQLPFDVAAQITHDDVLAIVGWHLDYLELEGAATEAAYADAPDGVVVASDDALAYVLGRASESGLAVDDVQVVAVFDAEQAYLEAIGAIGSEVPDGESPQA